MIFIIAIFISGIVNLIKAPFWIMGFPHGFLLPVYIQVAWLILVVSGLIFIHRRPDWAPASSWRWAAVGLFVALLFIFRTEYPSVNGDGEYGAAGYMTWSDVGRTDATSNERRLASHLNRLASPILSGCPQFTFHVGMPEKANPFATFSDFIKARRDVNNSWILISMIVGVLTALSVMRVSAGMSRSEVAKLGTVLFVLFSPPMLNMFGHFDSYWMPVIVILCWFRIILDDGLPPWKRYGYSMALAILGMWSHPILVLLLLFTFLHVCFSFISRTSFRRSLPYLSLMFGLGLGMLPMLSRGGACEWSILNSQMLLRFTAERLLLALATALPAILLGLIALVHGCRSRSEFSRSHAFASTIYVAALVNYFTLNYLIGPVDELNLCVTGTMVLGASWMLWRISALDDRAILYAGLLSIYIFIPKAYVFSNVRVIDYFRYIQPYSVCASNQSGSPYIMLALRCPVDDDKCRAKFLDVLREGIDPPHSLWAGSGLLNLHYLTAWNYEFGDQNQGRKQLDWLLDNAASSVPSLWFNGARFTDRYENKAVKYIRRDSIAWIQPRLQKDPENLDLRGMGVVLRKCETGDWTPSEIRDWSYEVKFKGNRVK
jgi:hypothetical protein